MNCKHPTIFRRLRDDEVRLFRAAAERDFAAATDTFEVNAVHHPVYRERIGELVAEQAREELRP